MTTEYMQAAAALIQAQGECRAKVGRLEQALAEARQRGDGFEAVAAAVRDLRTEVHAQLHVPQELHDAEVELDHMLRLAFPALRGGDWSAYQIPAATRACGRLCLELAALAPVPVAPGEVTPEQFLHAPADLVVPPLADAAALAAWMLAAQMLSRPGSRAAGLLADLHRGWRAAFDGRREEAFRRRGELSERFDALCRALPPDPY